MRSPGTPTPAAPTPEAPTPADPTIGRQGGTSHGLPDNAHLDQTTHLNQPATPSNGTLPTRGAQRGALPQRAIPARVRPSATPEHGPAATAGPGIAANTRDDWPCPTAHCVNQRSMVFGARMTCPKCGAGRDGAGAGPHAALTAPTTCPDSTAHGGPRIPPHRHHPTATTHHRNPTPTAGPQQPSTAPTTTQRAAQRRHFEEPGNRLHERSRSRDRR